MESNIEHCKFQKKHNDILFLPMLSNKQLLASFSMKNANKDIDKLPTMDKYCSYTPESGKIDFNSTGDLNLNEFCQCQIKIPKSESSSSPIVKSTLMKCPEIGRSQQNSQLLYKKGVDEKVKQLAKVLFEANSLLRSVVIRGKQKAAPRADSPCLTRSRYIGVSKNGSCWQALISIKKRKTYIGSYQDEYHAALAFDFYSIVFNSLKAKTNFSYSKSDILEMINNYWTNGGTFQPYLLAYNKSNTV